MKIAVCIKQVVTREWQLRVNEGKTWIRDQDASFELNEPDAYALEEALRLKEKHTGEVVVVSAGPARAAQVRGLQGSLALRNPYVDPLSLLQVSLLKKKRALPENDPTRELLDQALGTTLNGIAQAMRNTG